jgi:arginyl-tRNA synthetase
LILQKSDGGFGYAATDLAAVRHRIRVLQADLVIYVVGLPQCDHLGMVFQTAEEAGWLAHPARAEHVGHGSILGADGKMLRSRDGVSVKLVDLLEESVRRAGSAVGRKNPDLDPARRAAVARAVGIGAVKYADLSTDRIKDYQFNLDRMLSFEGSTAPYLQYARARICSIFRRVGTAPVANPGPVLIAEPAERALAIELLAFAPLVEAVADSWEFHRLAQYLFGLASAFTAFYEKCPVLKADPDVRDSRLVLWDLTARTLKTGLGLLGVDSPDQM